MLREEVDPLAIRRLEVLTGKERDEHLQYVIENEIKMEKRVMERI